MAGFSTSLMLPFPEIENLSVSASLALSCSRSMLAVTLKSPHNVSDYAQLPELSGLFVGQASLDVDSFLAICEQMAKGMEKK